MIAYFDYRPALLEIQEGRLRLRAVAPAVGPDGTRLTLVAARF